MPSRNGAKEKDDCVMLLSHCDLLMFLFVITVNQSLLHLHLLDEKNAFFMQKSPKNAIHLIALLAIVAYLIFTYKRVSQKDGDQKQKIALIFITTILITSNVLLLVKSLTPLSLSYLPLVMIGCFLTSLMVFRLQQYFKKHDHRLQLGYDVLMATPIKENCTTNYNWEENSRASYIESIQICIGLLGLFAISFELVYDKALTRTITLFKLEAPQLAHHLCIALQILTALFIIGCLIAKKMSSTNSQKSHNDNINNMPNIVSTSSIDIPLPAYCDDSSSTSTSEQDIDYDKLSDSENLLWMAEENRSCLPLFTEEELNKWMGRDTTNCNI